MSSLHSLIQSMKTHPPRRRTVSPTLHMPSSSFSTQVGRKPDDPACIYRGGTFQQSSCDYCALRQIKIDVRQCDIHGSCIDEFDARYRVRGVKKCQECGDYKSPELVIISSDILSKQVFPTEYTEPVTILKSSVSEGIFTKAFAYGITTIPERRTSTLPITIKSLANAGFTDPVLFIDDRDDAGWGLEATHVTAIPLISPPHLSLRKVFRTDGRVRAFGHWILSLWELFVRNPHADLYCMFQDDIIVSKNLRQYLDTITFPNRGYLNLYTFPSNQNIAPSTPGFYRSNQNGKSATALVFDKESIVVMLTSPHTMRKLRSHNHSAWKSIDGGVIQAFKDANPVGHWHEYVHSPSLIQHIGDKSTLGNPEHKKAVSFRGEEFDCMSLLEGK